MKLGMVVNRSIVVSLCTALFVVSTGTQGFTARESQAPETVDMKGVQSLQEDIAKNPLKPPDTSSPRATLKSFLDNANGAYRLVMAAHRENMKAPGLFTSESVHQMERHADQLIQRAVYCLDLHEVPDALKKSWGIEGALFLKEIFDRIELPPYEEIPDARAIEAEKEYKKIAGPLRWRVPKTKIVIAMAEEGPRQGEFLFAPEIVPRLDEFVEKVKHLPYKSGPSVSPGFLKFYDSHPGGLVPPKWSRWIPAALNTMYLFNTIWQWGFMAVLLLVTLLSIWAFYRWWNRRGHGFSAVKRTWGRALTILVGAVAALLDLYVIAEHVGISGPVLVVLNLALRTIFWFLLARAAYLIAIAVGETIIASPKIDSQGIHASLVRASTGFIGVFGAAIIIFHGLSRLGVSLIPLITGLGVGGLAVALAARPTLENLIGGFMILLDRPYRIGQRVQVKGYEGDVEKIGLRSTRIRLLTGNQTVIPNEEMARLDIENIGRRPHIRRQSNICITYNTPPEKVVRAVQIIEEILADHEGLDPRWPPKVFFDEFNSDSLNIVMRYWYHPPDLWAFRAFNHKVNMQILRAFEKEGIEFAFPTTTNYLTQADGEPLHINIANELELNSQNRLRQQ